MPYPPQGSGARLPIDAAQVKSIPASATLFSNNTLHTATSRFPTFSTLHRIPISPDRIYTFRAIFSARTTNPRYRCYVRLAVRCNAGGAAVSQDIWASTTSTIFTTLTLLKAEPIIGYDYVELQLATDNSDVPVESRSEELVATYGKLVGD